MIRRWLRKRTSPEWQVWELSAHPLGLWNWPLWVASLQSGQCGSYGRTL
jgi:hypothetical protein